jgi:hypothetical protein
MMEEWNKGTNVNYTLERLVVEEGENGKAELAGGKR